MPGINWSLAVRKNGGSSFRFLMLVVAIVLGLAGCGASVPADSFTSLPVRVVQDDNESGYSENGGEDITVGDLFNNGITNPNAEKSWKKNSGESWTIIIKDKVRGDEVNIVLIQKSSPDRALFDRILINGKELQPIDKVDIFSQFGAAAYRAKAQAK